MTKKLGELFPISSAGLWWWAERPEDKFIGTLTFDSEHAGSLKLIGGPAKQGMFRQRPGQNVMHGQGAVAERISLINPWILHQQSSSTGIQEVEMHFSLAVIGAWFESIDAPCIKRFSATFAHAEAWVKESGFRLKYAKNVRDYTVRYKTVRPQKFSIGKGLALRIGRMHSVPGGLSSGGTLNLEERVEMAIESPSPKSLSFFLQNMTTLRDFLTLGTMRLASPGRVSLTCDFSKAQKPEFRKQEKYANLAVKTIFKDADTSSASQIDFLFTEADLGPHLVPALQAWFQKEGALKHALILYNCAIYSEQYHESQFLFFAQCVETLHRRTRGGTYVSPDEFAKILPVLTGAIPQGLDAPFKAAIKSRLKFANEFSLRRRLQLIFKEHAQVAAAYGIKGDFEASAITDARNYFTHYEAPSEGFSRDNVNLGRLCLLLRLVIEATLLAEMGLAPELISALLKKNQYYLRNLKYGFQSSGTPES